MFTGLVTAIGTVRSVTPRGTGREIVIASPFSDLQLGESVACNGVCLTVEGGPAQSPGGGSGAFQVVAGEETLRRTTLSELSPGIRFHLERALHPMDRLGGHIVQGHVDGIGTIFRVDRRPGFIEIEVEAPTELMKLCVEKGSVCVDGVSLTVNSLTARTFTVGIIPHTAKATNLGSVTPGQRVNLEADVLAKLVQRLLAPYLLDDAPSGEGASRDASLLNILRSNGFLKDTP